MLQEMYRIPPESLIVAASPILMKRYDEISREVSALGGPPHDIDIDNMHNQPTLLDLCVLIRHKVERTTPREIYNTPARPEYRTLARSSAHTT